MFLSSMQSFNLRIAYPLKTVTKKLPLGVNDFLDE